jgi:hypothetical protein
MSQLPRDHPQWAFGRFQTEADIRQVAEGWGVPEVTALRQRASSALALSVRLREQHRRRAGTA